MSLIRTLSEEYLLGEYSNNGQNSKFLILRMNDYDQGYSSMLVWEKTMEEDFTLLFQKENVQQITNEGQKTKWEDLVIDNRDVRILRKDNGEILIYYLFINKDELIITNNLDTLKELTTRILIKK